MNSNVLAMIFTPHKQWQTIANNPPSSILSPLIYTLILALIPALSWYFGTTRVGWDVGTSENIRLTTDSAKIIITLFYIAMIVCICIIGYLIHWMAVTYGSDSSIAKGILVATSAASPLFLSGLCGLFPQFFIVLFLGLITISYSVYLLYIGIPIVMNIPKERGFLFSSAILGVCLVIFIALMASSVILWDLGAAPHFTD